MKTNAFDILVEQSMKIATAESCTGGLIGSRITDVPGASRYYAGGIIAYSNEAKINILGVSPETIRNYGAVSEECAREMVMGVVKIFRANVGIAITGIAGPSGGTPEKPVGTVYIAYYLQGHVTAERVFFTGSRIEIKEKIVDHALEKLFDMVSSLF